MSEQRPQPGSEPEKAVTDRQERMQRVRVGLTGLAVVLLLVFVATFLIGRIQPPAANNSATAAVNEASGDEPLADLGVAPRASPENETDPPTAK